MKAIVLNEYGDSSHLKLAEIQSPSLELVKSR